MKNNNCMKKFTEKDLLYLEDMFSWNMQALKLVNSFIGKTENEEVMEILEEIFDMHYENLNTCINVLEGNYHDDYEEEYEGEHCHFNECECGECNYGKEEEEDDE